MTKYILDTDIVSYMEDPASPNYTTVKNNVLALDESDEIYVLPFLFYEINFGIAVARNEQTKKLFVSIYEAAKEDFPVLPFTEKGADIFGQLKSNYMKKHGLTKTIATRHNIDFMLAASAIVENAVLVSNDNIFKAVQEYYPALMTENWAEPCESA